MKRNFLYFRLRNNKNLYLQYSALNIYDQKQNTIQSDGVCHIKNSTFSAAISGKSNSYFILRIESRNYLSFLTDMTNDRISFRVSINKNLKYISTVEIHLFFFF